MGKVARDSPVFQHCVWKAANQLTLHLCCLFYCPFLTIIILLGYLCLCGAVLIAIPMEGLNYTGNDRGLSKSLFTQKLFILIVYQHIISVFIIRRFITQSEVSNIIFLKKLFLPSPRIEPMKLTLPE